MDFQSNIWVFFLFLFFFCKNAGAINAQICWKMNIQKLAYLINGCKVRSPEQNNVTNPFHRSDRQYYCIIMFPCKYNEHAPVFISIYCYSINFGWAQNDNFPVKCCDNASAYHTLKKADTVQCFINWKSLIYVYCLPIAEWIWNGRHYRFWPTIFVASHFGENLYKLIIHYVAKLKQNSKIISTIDKSNLINET